jgi:hypothetical protein
LPPNTQRIGGSSDALSQGVPTLLLPSWIDSRYITAVSQVEAPETLSDAGGAVLSVPGDVERWAIGFITLATNAQPVAIAPWNDCRNYPFASLAAGQSIWFPLSVYGPLVTDKWFVGSSAGYSVRVVSVKRF